MTESRAEYYGRKAAEARQMAEATKDVAVRAGFQQLEQCWLELAQQEERSRRTNMK
jgi:hypothetical protein